MSLTFKLRTAADTEVSINSGYINKEVTTLCPVFSFYRRIASSFKVLYLWIKSLPLFYRIFIPFHSK